MRKRRLRKTAAELEVTAFINLIVVLVPFLLSTAVFTKLSVQSLAMPAAAEAGLAQLKAETLQLEVVLRPDALEVGDRVGGLIQRIPAAADGPDLAALATLLQAVKTRFPDEQRASVLAEPDTPYQQIVGVMDTVREAGPPPGGEHQRRPLFPELAVGDAPRRTP